jgi:uncharacterized membrane protein YqgA involved in biofilm formation
MLGTLLNAGAIFLGALLGLTTKLDVSLQRQQLIKVLLGLATSWFGLKLFWDGLRWHGATTTTAQQFFFQLVVVLLAMIVGHLLGKLCRIQVAMNRLGQNAKTKLEHAATEGKKAASDGLFAATLLFCAAPLGIVGALEDGLRNYFQPLAVKAVMDGLAALSFARMFGWMAMLAALPLGAFLYCIALLGTRLAPWLEAQMLLGVVHASGGLIITYVALVIFEIKKVEIGNYLPALVVAPALMKLSQALHGW